MMRRGGMLGALGLLLTGGLVAGAALYLRGGDAEPVEPPPAFEAPTALAPESVEARIDPPEAVGAEVVEPEVVEEDLTYTWQPRAIGGGGFIKGLKIHPSGEPVLARADIGGVYRYDRAEQRWSQLFLEGNVVGGGDYTDYAVESLAIADSDPDRIYAGVGVAGAAPDGRRGRVMASSDGGVTWVPSPAQFAINGDIPNRSGGERISVAPDDANEVWLGTTDGLWRSLDGAASFERVESAPMGISSIEDGVGIEWVVAHTDRVYIGVAGAGVYMSEDDGGSWVELFATTTLPFDAEVDASGTLWATNRDDDVIWRYDPATGAGTEVSGVDGEIRGVAVTRDGSTVVILGEREFWYSTDGGDSWDRSPVEFVCDELPWMNTYDAWSLFTAASPEFDPLSLSGLWVPHGFGVFEVPDFRASVVRLECRSIGIEELVNNDLVSVERDVVVAGNWDRPIFRLPAGGEATAQVGPSDRFNSAWDLSTSPADPLFIAAVVADHRFCCEADGQAYQSGFSTDGGVTWQRFESYESGNHPDRLRFGTIAVSSGSVDDMVWVPTFNAPLHVTHDRGATWTEIILPGTEDRIGDDGLNAGGSHFNFFLQREVVVADPVRPEVFYLYHQDLGIFRSDDFGDTWTQISDDSLPTGWTVGWFHAQLVAVPGEEGHLLFTPGELGEGLFGLYESLDGGATWDLVAGASAVDVIGFGVAPGDGEQLAVYLVGNINNVYGVYMSPDMMATWELLDTAPLGLYNRIHAITGDAEIPGRVYVGFRGNSVVQGDPG